MTVRQMVHAILVTILFLWPVAFSSGQTFGLGDDAAVEVAAATAVADTFGLDQPITTPVVVTSAPAKSITTATTTVVRSGPYRSPPGYHRHVTRAGVVVEHHNSNHGDPVAHAGIDRPWPKYYGPVSPGNTVHGGATNGVSHSGSNGKMETGSVVAPPVFVSSCPGGVCPSPRGGLLRRGVFRR